MYKDKNDVCRAVVSEVPFISHQRIAHPDGVCRDHFYDKDGLELRSHHLKAPGNMKERWASEEELKLIMKYEPKKESTHV